MTFPDCLRTLAQLRPEVFGFRSEYIDYTQDDLDRILLELDRRVLLRESVTVEDSFVGRGRKRSVRLVATIFDKDWNRLATIETDETEKNPAMRKALVAVVEEMKGEKR